MHANIEGGAVFMIFDAVEFPDEHPPIYIGGKLVERNELICDLSLILAHAPEKAIGTIGKDRTRKLVALRKENGHDPNRLSHSDPNRIWNTYTTYSSDPILAKFRSTLRQSFSDATDFTSLHKYTASPFHLRA
jgi:hypothetical protein